MMDGPFTLKTSGMLLHKLMHNPVMAYLRKPMHADCAKLILRLAVGAVFMFHGWAKLQGLDVTAMFFGKIGIPMPQLMAPFVAGVEFFGGALMILGLGARLMAFLLACVMVVAVAQAKGFAWGKSELELSLLAMNLSLLLSGAGAYSLDAKMMKKGMGEHDAALPMPKPQA